MRYSAGSTVPLNALAAAHFFRSQTKLFGILAAYSVAVGDSHSSQLHKLQKPRTSMTRQQLCK